MHRIGFEPDTYGIDVWDSVYSAPTGRRCALVRERVVKIGKLCSANESCLCTVFTGQDVYTRQILRRARLDRCI